MHSLYSYSLNNYTLSLVLYICLSHSTAGAHVLPLSLEWDRAMYTQISPENFRDEAVFNQKLKVAQIDYALMNACIFYLSNEQRIAAGLTPLSYAAELEIAAWHHSKQMLELDFFEHRNTKNPDRFSTEQRARLAGIQNPSIAENIAFQGGGLGKGSYLEVAEIFVKQWMNSPGHRSNILCEKAVQMGTGLYTDGKKWYATQCFQWTKEIKATNGLDGLP